MKYNYREICERIRKQRNEKFSTQADFIKALGSKGVKMGRNRLSAIESGAEYDKQSFTLHELSVMCELFECDMEYFLGECDEDIKTLDFQRLHDATGLSGKAIENLIKIKKDSLYFEPTKIVESEHFYQLVKAFQDLVYNVNVLSAKIEELEELLPEWDELSIGEQYMKVGIMEDKIHSLRYEKYELADICHDILEDITRNDSFDTIISRGDKITHKIRKTMPELKNITEHLQEIMDVNK